MGLAYLMNIYPITSTTFVRQEIHAHEAVGLPVVRFAIREWAEVAVDPHAPFTRS
jgi:colanic acid/amylovoran biosynthesis glycosyltransferase